MSSAVIKVLEIWALKLARLENACCGKSGSPRKSQVWWCVFETPEQLKEWAVGQMKGGEVMEEDTPMSASVSTHTCTGSAYVGTHACIT